MVKAKETMKKDESSPMTYPNAESRSAELYERAQRVLTDGGSRTTICIAPYSIYVAKAQGKYVTDVDGNELFDLNYNYTSMIHGHSHPAIVEAVKRQVGKGTGFSFASEMEFALAELLCDRCDNFDKIRFMNSGTEAVMKAIKAARAYTGKPKIAKCENSYHGSYDFAEVSLGVEPTDLAEGDPVSRPYTYGTPQGVLDDVIVIPFNDVSNARRILEEHINDLAAVLFDPIGANLARVPPTDEFLAMLQGFCDQHDALLIADEVIAFRAGMAGVQGDRGIRPDLTTLGKIIGGGFPVGAVAGRAEIMAVFESGETKAKVSHGGTFNANPVTMVAGYTAMQMLTEDAFAKLNALGDAFRKGIQEVFDLTNTEGTAEGQYSIFGIATEDPDLNDLSPRGHVYRSSGLHQYMVQHGYWLTPGMAGVLCTLMDSADIDPFCETLREGILELKGRN
ncbi:MAG: aspartate aminotransferase family protein [Pseudomonadota bacterium]